MPDVVLDFERPVVELEQKIRELKQLGSETVEFSDEIKKLEQKANKLQDEIFKSLTPWQRTQLSRHSQRPYTLDYIPRIFEDFLELHGDRNYMDDPAIVGGLAKIDGTSIVVIGHQKGRNTKDKVYRNFGMPRPEGYRKALRLMSLAERFNKPIVTLIDTPGAYPGIGAEERGQAEAIAKNLLVMARLRVPVISVVIGEGGSGGALAIGVCNRLIMMEHSIYSVISPEGAATILWKDATKAPQAADTLRYTPTDAVEFGICDEIIKEPRGGAHRNWDQAAQRLHKTVRTHLTELLKMTPDELVDHRYNKLRVIGSYTEKLDERQKTAG